MKAISGKRMCRILEAKGWTLARSTGSHRIYSGKILQLVIGESPRAFLAQAARENAATGFTFCDRG